MRNTQITTAVATIIISTTATTSPARPSAEPMRANEVAKLQIAQAEPNTSSQPRVNFDVPEQTLAETLRTIGRQTSINIVFTPESVEKLRAPALKGVWTAHEALTRALAGTQLEFKQATENSILIRKTALNTAQNSASSKSELRLSGLTPSPSPGKRDERSKVTASVEAAAKDSSESSKNRDDESQDPSPIQEVLVTGTHIRGAADIVTPSILITRNDIEKTGFSTVESLFESLPQNFDAVSTDGAFTDLGVSTVAAQNVRVWSSAIDLRGLGAESTLTLVNGKRRAGAVGRFVDVSAIPLSAVERVEVVTGGASAIYGADAVAGVVNISLRRDFEGAETQVSYGGPSGYHGGQRFQVDQIWGRKADHGGLVVAYDYSEQPMLDMADSGQLSPTGQNGNVYATLPLQPESSQHSAFVAGNLQLGNRAEAYVDLLYTDRKFQSITARNLGTTNEFREFNTTPSKQYGGTGGVKVRLGGSWEADLSGAYSAVDIRRRAQEVRPDSTANAVDPVKSHLSTFSVVADGGLFSQGGVTPRAAIGAEYRKETLRRDFTYRTTGFSFSEIFAGERTVRSAFTELRIPFLQDDNASDKKTLELSLGARYDDYTDVGSSFNHTAGLIWKPNEEVALRAAYATAFRAPSLVDLRRSGSVFLLNASDPRLGGADAPVLYLGGVNPSLTPEEASSWSTTLDYTPKFAPWGRVTLSWFSVDYKERLETPMTFADLTLALQREDEFASLITRDPSDSTIAAYLDANTDVPPLVFNGTGTGDLFLSDPSAEELRSLFPNLTLVDFRFSNLAVETVRGLDLGLGAAFDSHVGRFTVDVNATNTLTHDYRVTSTSRPATRMNEVGKPVDLRLRGRFGFERGAFGNYLYLNYVDRYSNPLDIPPSRVKSWTTVDFTLRFDGARLRNAGGLRGFSASLSASNLLDQEPPHVEGTSSYGLLYDSANASAIGRSVTLRLVNRW